MAVGFARLDGAGHANRLSHKQQALGDGGLTGIRVGNNGKGAALGHLGSVFAHAVFSLLAGKWGAIIAILPVECSVHFKVE